MEKTLAIIKPDGVERNIIGDILSMYEKGNLKIIDIEMHQISIEKAEAHYFEHKGKYFYDELINYITSGPLVIIELEADNAVKILRDINDEVRKKFGISMTKNTVHGSDSIKSAEREIGLFFGDRI